MAKPAGIGKSTITMGNGSSVLLTTCAVTLRGIVHAQFGLVISQSDRQRFLLGRPTGFRQMVSERHLIDGRRFAAIGQRQAVAAFGHERRKVNLLNDVGLAYRDNEVAHELSVATDFHLLRPAVAKRLAGARQQGLQGQHGGLRRIPRAAAVALADQPRQGGARGGGMATGMKHRQA